MKQTELLNIIIANKIADVNICLPAKIVEYDYTQQRAKVQPSLNQKYNDGEVIELPIVHNVPVMHPSSGGASITFPVNVGDNILLVFSQASLEEWLEDGKQSTPDDPRQNDLTDAIAIIGLNPFNQISPATNNTDLLIKLNDAEVIFKPTGNIHINGTASNITIDNINITGAVNIKGDLTVSGNITSATATIGIIDFATHIHGGVMAGGGVTTPPQ